MTQHLVSLFRRLLPAVAALASCSLLSGCTAMMPKEIQQMESRTSALARKLSAESDFHSGNYTSNGRNIHFVEITDGMPKPLVLFIHGSPGSWQVWADYLSDPDLQRLAHMISVDRPGFGGSGHGVAERVLDQQCKEIAPLLDKAAPGQRIVVIGHSYGGPVAARLAMDYGNKITDLILFAGSIDPVQEHTKWFQYPADWPIFSWIVPSDLIVANREIRHLKSDLTVMLPLWPTITQRVTMIQGENDDLVPPENADFAAKVLTRAYPLDIIRIPDQNHFLPWNQFALVKSELIKHLH